MCFCICAVFFKEDQFLCLIKIRTDSFSALYPVFLVDSNNCQDHIGGLMQGGISHPPPRLSHSLVRFWKGGKIPALWGCLEENIIGKCVSAVLQTIQSLQGFRNVWLRHLEFIISKHEKISMVSAACCFLKNIMIKYLIVFVHIFEIGKHLKLSKGEDVSYLLVII